MCKPQTAVCNQCHEKTEVLEVNYQKFLCKACGEWDENTVSAVCPACRSGNLLYCQKEIVKSSILYMDTDCTVDTDETVESVGTEEIWFECERCGKIYDSVFGVEAAHNVNALEKTDAGKTIRETEKR